MAAFGSAARGDMQPDSDVDILVDLEPDAHPGLRLLPDREEVERTVRAARRPGREIAVEAACESQRPARRPWRCMRRDAAYLADILSAADPAYRERTRP